jgi:patatin-like phospholipase/acyl hydrolase
MFLAKYGNPGRYDFLLNLLGDLRMTDLMHHTLIPTLQIQEGNWKLNARLVTNFQKPKTETEDVAWKEDETQPEPSECRLLDVLTQTTAAPTYFPSYQGHIDGGCPHTPPFDAAQVCNWVFVSIIFPFLSLSYNIHSLRAGAIFANNPSLVATCKAREFGVPLENIHVLCFSTGTRKHNPVVSMPKVDWGWLQWALPLLKISINVTEILTNTTCKMMLGDRYHRWSVITPDEYSMDSVEHMDAMLRDAMEVDISDTLNWVQEHWVGQ